MTTQELKEYIGRVLGNSIRCLLPSYWWKRLFGLVVDKVEEVEKEVPELVASSLAEFAKKFPDIESRTFYIQGNHEHNLSLLLKIGEEYETTGLVKQLYLAYYINPDDNGFIVISPQFGVFDGRGYAFYDVVTPFTRIKQDVIIKQDGSVEITDAFYLGKTDTELSATSIFPLANYVLTQCLWNKVSVIEISSKAHYFNKEIYNKLDTGFVPTVICKNRSEYTSSDKLIYQVSYCEIFGSSKRLWAYLFNMGEGAGIEGSVNSHAYIIIDLDSEGITTIVKEGVMSSSGSSYDDTELKKQLNTKQDEITDLETIRSGAALGATAIQSVKTINGESIVGDGNIEIKANVDTSTLATKEMVTSLSNEVVANEEVTAAALNELNERINAISENVSGETATKVELQSAVESLTNTILENEEITAAALNDLNERIENAGGGGTVDLSSYATKQEVEDGLNGKQDEISDLETIRSGAAKGATALQSYTEKYTGTYSKPSTGIPKTDLASTVQTSLGKADTALQSVPDTYATKTNLAEALAPIGALYTGAWTATKTEGISQLYTERITVPAGTYIISAVLPYAKVGHGNQICIGFTAKMAIGVGNTFLDASYGCTTQIATFTTTTSIAVMSAASANSAEWDYLDRGGIAALRIK